MKRAATIAVFLFAGAASAQEYARSPGGANHWSTVTGETVSPDRDALRFDLGWPGIGFTYLHGLGDRRDIGFHFELLYGWEQTSNSKFGLGFGVPYRLIVNRHERVSVELHIEPGMRVYPGNAVTGASDFFIRAPFGGTLGLQITPELRVAAEADLNFAIQIPNTAFLEIGPEFGFAIEYAVDRNLNVAFDTRFGPQFYSISGAATDFAFITNVTLGYRM
jgi:hypothetical protein